MPGCPANGITRAERRAANHVVREKSRVRFENGAVAAKWISRLGKHDLEIVRIGTTVSRGYEPFECSRLPVTIARTTPIIRLHRHRAIAHPHRRRVPLERQAGTLRARRAVQQERDLEIAATFMPNGAAGAAQLSLPPKKHTTSYRQLTYQTV